MGSTINLAAVLLLLVLAVVFLAAKRLRKALVIFAFGVVGLYLLQFPWRAAGAGHVVEKRRIGKFEVAVVQEHEGAGFNLTSVVIRS